MSYPIRKNLIIGLGGTGMRAVLYAKKRFIEAYGEIPPMIKFLVIDTTDKDCLETEKGKIVVEPREFLKIEVRNPRSMMLTNKEVKEWLPESFPRLAFTLPKQERATGRLAIFANADSLEKKIVGLISDIRDFRIGRHSGKYELPSDSIVVNLVCSLAGATGSGCFLDIAVLTRENLPSTDKLISYFLLPDIFVGRPATEKVEPNTYGAIKEINYFFTDEGKIRYNLGGRERRIDKGLFNAVYLINNVNMQGVEYSDIGDLQEFLGMGIFLQSSSTGKVGGDIIDNIEAVLVNKCWFDKPTVYSSFGIGELVYPGDWLATRCAMKVALGIAQVMSKESTDLKIPESLQEYARSLVIEISKEINAMAGEKQKKPFVYEIKPSFLMEWIPTVKIQDFLQWIQTTKKITVLELAKLSIKDVKNILLEYGNSQEEVIRIKERRIDDILRDLPEDERIEYVGLLDKMAAPLWQYDQELIAGDKKTENIYLFGVENPDDTVFAPEGIRTVIASPHKPFVVGTGDPKRVVCLKVEAAVPAFVIKNMRRYREKYMDPDRPFPYHIHKDWEKALPNLFPGAEEEEARKYWSLALADPFNLISKIKEFYYIESEKKGRKLDDYKVKLAQGRAGAMRAFLKDTELIEETKENIERITQRLGNEKVMEALKTYGDELEKKARRFGKEIRDQLEVELNDIEEHINELSEL